MANRSVTDRKPRSVWAQINRMQRRWPDFRLSNGGNGFISWVGPLRGLQQPYSMRVFWSFRTLGKPYVQLIAPPLKPREGASYEVIPHLIYFADKPELSALCLFDPDGCEWKPTMLIADTTVPWAADWLKHYEFWHYDGIWRGKSVGPESVAKSGT
jgi:hypothetical protein